jgi:hypothetical protein
MGKEYERREGDKDTKGTQKKYEIYDSILNFDGILSI